MSKPSSNLRAPATPSALDHWLPGPIRIPLLISLVALVGIPFLFDLGGPSTASTAAKNAAASKSGSSSSNPGSSAASKASAANHPGPPRSPYLPPPEFGKIRSTPTLIIPAAAPPAEVPKETSEPQEPAYQRPQTAPNGAPWPEESDYVEGYEQQATGGLSTVTIDNSRNADDVFLKLTALQGNNFQPARTAYVKAFSQFTFTEVQAGNYDVRFLNLSTGAINATAPFVLRETPTPEGGVRYNNYSVTLYNVTNGNMKLRPLKDNQF